MNVRRSIVPKGTIRRIMRETRGERTAITGTVGGQMAGPRYASKADRPFNPAGEVPTWDYDRGRDELGQIMSHGQ